MFCLNTQSSVVENVETEILRQHRLPICTVGEATIERYAVISIDFRIEDASRFLIRKKTDIAQGPCRARDPHTKKAQKPKRQHSVCGMTKNGLGETTHIWQLLRKDAFQASVKKKVDLNLRPKDPPLPAKGKAQASRLLCLQNLAKTRMSVNETTQSPQDQNAP